MANYKVRKKEFEIDFLSNAAAKGFNELMQVDAGAVDLEDQKAIQNVLKKQTEVAEKGLEIVEIILDGNDIKYDKKWWERKTSPTDVLTFIIQVYTDNIGDGVKKNQQGKVS